MRKASLVLLAILALLPVAVRASDDVASPAIDVKPLSEGLAEKYKLDPAFYRKSALVQNILIATSARVSDFAILEAAYQFDMVMKELRPHIAQRIRDKGVLCLLIGHDELTSDLPQFTTKLTGKELDFYNWRQRGFLTTKNGRPTVVFAEEDVLEYDGGMQTESILIHEFGHVVDNAGFDEELRKRLTAAFKRAKDKDLWNDGYAAQRFRRVASETPVSLLDALVKAFPDQSPELFKKCLDGGDILVNGKATTVDAKVTKNDKVLIVFGGPKLCYAMSSRAEYWAEGYQCWYDTNRTMDHDHNHIQTRGQLEKYDAALADLCREVMGDSPWRFVSPRKRAGVDHLKGYDPGKSPKVKKLEHIDIAAQDYYDTYWKTYWPRLYEKHSLKPEPKAPAAKDIGERMAAFLESKKGQRIADGECANLATEALRVAGAKFIRSDWRAEKDYVWSGTLLTKVSIDNGKVIWSHPEAKLRPGDVIQYTDAKFRDGTAAPHHTAVVAAIDANRRVTEVYEQNVGLPGMKKDERARHVVRRQMGFSTLTAGFLKVYRPEERLARPGRFEFTVVNSTGEKVDVMERFGKVTSAYTLTAANATGSFHFREWTVVGTAELTLNVDGASIIVEDRAGYEIVAFQGNGFAIRKLLSYGPDAKPTAILVGLRTPTGWLLDIAADGSGQLTYGASDIWKIKPGTFDFAQVTKDLKAIRDVERCCGATHFVIWLEEDRKGPNIDTNRYTRESKTVLGLFERAIEAAQVRSQERGRMILDNHPPGLPKER